MNAPALLVGCGLVSGTLLMVRLRSLAPLAVPTPVTVGVVIPARDEATRLPRLLDSLARQALPATVTMTVTVVDDQSTDATAAVAAAAAAGVSVVPAGERPAGWAGKTWACEVGRRENLGTTLTLFLDADVELASDAVGRLVADYQQRGDTGLLSVQPYHVTRRPSEQLSAIPSAVAVMASGIAAIRQPSRLRLAFGPCMITSTDVLDRLGGFSSIRGDPVEDVALAGLYADAALPLSCLAGKDTVRFRMYENGLGDLVEGWTKNLTSGARHAPLGAVVGATLWVTGALSTLAVVGSPNRLTVALAAAYAGHTWWVLRSVGRFHPVTSLLYPVAFVGFVALFLRSAYHRIVRRRVSWKGRSIPLEGVE